MYSSTFFNSFVFKEVHYDVHHQSHITAGSGHNYVMYLQKGRAQITTDSETFCLEPGDILHIPRGSVYSTAFTGEPEIHFGSYAYINCPGVAIHNYKMQKVSKSPEMDKLIHLVSKNGGANCRSIGLFYLFLAEMSESLKAMSEDKKTVVLENAMQYIRQMPESNMPEVAKHCGISEAGLYNLFKDYADMSPATFRMNVKLEKAYNYLVSTDIPIEEVSDICGFSSSSYFRKKFVAVYNKSPREIRKNGGR